MDSFHYRGLMRLPGDRGGSVLLPIALLEVTGATCPRWRGIAGTAGLLRVARDATADGVGLVR